MKTLFISDTHGYHDHLLVEDNTEMIIHSGDASNFRSPAFNFNEMVNFIS
jgi:predicted phosphodiesterase